MCVQFFMHPSFFPFLFNIHLHRPCSPLWRCFSSSGVASQESCLGVARRRHSCRVRSLTVSAHIHHQAPVKGLAGGDREQNRLQMEGTEWTRARVSRIRSNGRSVGSRALKLIRGSYQRNAVSLGNGQGEMCQGPSRKSSFPQRAQMKRF